MAACGSVLGRLNNVMLGCRYRGLKCLKDLYEARTPLAPACIKLSAHMKHTNNSTYMKKLKTSNQTAINSLPGKSAFVIDRDRLTKFLEEVKDDMPVSDMPDPFQKENKRCLLCQKNIDVDYKNVRLLSQFISPYTGRIYGRAVTGLCIPMQRRVSTMIKRSRMAGFMPYLYKTPQYLKDPRLFDPFKPAKSKAT